ncbi:MAG: colanic acid biosynthesis glycosyltransferase WcaI, partial [Candidatus Sulfotelmatobacter sp.]
MKVLFLSINYWPEVTGIGAFTTYRAEHLAASGHEVEVCTTFPYYPEWRVPPPYAGRIALSEERNGVKIFRG